MTSERKAQLAALVGAVVVVLVATEGLLRHFDLPRFDACSATADFATPDPELGFAGPPGGVVANEKLNARGRRGPLVDDPKPSGRFRILFIGDSTCWGLGVDLEEAFPVASTSLVAADQPEREFDYLIGALPGYSTYQSKIQLRRMLPMEPDLVVFYVGARNDSTRHRYFEDSEIPERHARLDAPWHRVRLLRLFEAGKDRLYKSVGRKLLTLEARARVPLDAFRANVAEMAGQVAQAGLPALIVLPPASEKLLAREPLAVRYREVLSAVARERDIPTVSLQDLFEDTDSASLYFEDGYHFAVEGHAVAAEAIHRAIVDHDLTRRDR